MAMHISDPLPPLRTRCPDVPERVSQVVGWMTAKSPEARPHSYAELLVRLRPESPSSPFDTSATALTTMPMRPQPAPRRSRRRHILAAVASVVLAGIAGLFTHARYPAPQVAFSVAVAPFFGPDPESDREGRVFASMIESELSRQFPDDEVAIVGVDETRKTARSARAAKALIQNLDVDVLVWGEAFALRDEVEVVSRITLRDGSTTEHETSPAPFPVGAGSIEARRVRAASLAMSVTEVRRRLGPVRKR
jgi:hypothetical protein